MVNNNPFSEYVCSDITFDQPLSKKTSYGTGGKARYYIEPKSLYIVNKLLECAKEKSISYKVIGNGTNIVFSDKGFDGLIISTRRLKDIFFKRDEISVMSGATINDLVNFAYENNLEGVEFLHGIPATVGGAITMNASCYNTAISDHITTVSTIKNGKIAVYDKWDCGFGYRKSRFYKSDEVIVSATFSLKKGCHDEIGLKMKCVSEKRKESQPQGRSCGSVFKNPDNLSAGKIIDELGLKGLSVGGASVSEKHGNFIVTKGDVKAQDIYELVKIIKTRVREKTGINLVEEVEFTGVF